MRLNPYDMAVKDTTRMTPDLSHLPEGQRRAVLSLIGVEQDRTYLDAAWAPKRHDNSQRESQANDGFPNQTFGG